jgi:hypothetical protein
MQSTEHGSKAELVSEERGSTTSLSAAATHVEPRRIWNPEGSDLLERTLVSLTAKIIDGSVSLTIRPQTLRDLGGDFAALYHAAFHRTSRPAWAVALFPNGFASLVDEINERLKEHAITVSDTKLDVAMYGRLTKDELGAIRVFQELVRSGEMSRDSAISELREDHSIVLSGARQDYYFGRGVEAPHSQGHASDLSLEERKLALATSIEKVRGQLGVDLSIRECVQGLLFEAFVGAYLTHRYGAEQIISQKRLPIAYRDLSGSPHRCVYLDYYRDDATHPEVFEVKLRNSFEGIVNSAIPQLIAFEDLTQSRQTITVIYRHVSPQLYFSLDAGISIQPELEKMGFDPVRLGGRRLDQLISYVGVDDLLKADPNARVFQEALKALDTFMDAANVPLLKQYYDALLRVSSTNEDIEGRMNILRGLAEHRTAITPEQAARLFGRRPTRTDGGDEAETRVRMIRRGMASSRDALLRDLFKEIFGYPATALDECHIAKLEAVPQGQFQDAVMDIIGRREKAFLERASRGRPSREERVGQLKRAYQFALERERVRAQQELSGAQKHLEGTYEMVRTSNNAANDQLRKQIDQRAPAAAMRTLQQLGLLNGRKGRHFMRELQTMTEKHGTVRDIGKQALEALHRYLKEVVRAPTAVRSEREEISSGIDSLRVQVTRLLREEISAIKGNAAFKEIERWERKFRRRPQHGDFVAFKSALESAEVGADGFITSYHAMCEFAINMINNLPICAVDLLPFSMAAKRGSQAPGTAVVGHWGDIARLLLRRLDFQINHEIALLDEPPSVAMLNEWSVKLPRLLSSDSESVRSIETPFWRSSRHFAVVTALGQLFDGDYTRKLERLEVLCSSLNAEAHAHIVIDLARLGHFSDAEKGAFETEQLRDDQLSDVVRNFDRLGIFSFLLVNQYLARKTHQAKIMSLFSVEKAQRFMSDTVPFLPKDTVYPSVFELYPVVKAALDADYDHFIDVCSADDL